jgi:hypothetical protein
MVIPYLSVVVTVVGLVLIIAGEGKIASIGDKMFWVGLLAFLFGH